MCLLGVDRGELDCIAKGETVHLGPSSARVPEDLLVLISTGLLKC